MTALVIPAEIPAVARMRSTPVGAADLATDLRSALVNVKDVQHWAEGASGGGFGGDAADASEHRLARFARRLDLSEAALGEAVRAADRLEDRLTRLSIQRIELVEARAALNGAIAELRADVETGGDVDLTALRARSERLVARAERLRADIDTWQRRYDDAETDFIAALAAVDTVAEGAVAVAAAGRVDPFAVVGGLDRPVDPAAVAAWWGRLSRAEKQAVMAELPAYVGGLAGVPVDDRDEANRARLGADVDELRRKVVEGTATRDELDRLANAAAVRDVLEQRYGDAVDPETGAPLAHLTVYEPGRHTGDGGVALFLGDPGRADHVATYVPGTLSETGNLDTTLDNLDALRESVIDAGTNGVAVGFWLGYDAPSVDGLAPAELADLASVTTPAEAREAGADLADYLDGVRAADQGAPAHHSLVGHSYGATASAYAAQEGAPIDDLVLLGSPGAPVRTAAELTMADVHVASADRDPVSLLGGTVLPGPLGYDPAQSSFGEGRYEVAPGSYRVEDLLDNHSSYFEGAALDNLATVVTGEDPAPAAGRDPGGYQTLDELLLGTTLASGGEWLWERGEDAVEGLTGTVGDLGEGLVGLPTVLLPRR